MSLSRLRSALGKGACLILFVGLPSLAAGETLRVGVYHNPPKLQLDEAERPSGILGDLLTAMARREGWQLETVTCQWQACLQALERGEIDLLPDVGWSEARAERLDFHREPALHSWSQVYQGEGETLETALDLDGQRVAVLEGSMQHDYLRQLLESFGASAVWVPVASYDEAFAAVRDGDADVAVSNHFYGGWQAAEHGLRSTSIMFQPARLFYASSGGRQPAVLARIDAYLARWKSDGESPYYAALQRWRGAESGQTLIPPAVWWGMVALAGLLVFALGGNLLLKRRVAARTADLEAVKERLSTILDSVEAYIYIKAPDLRYTYANRKVCELLDLSPEQVVGKRDSDFFDAETVASLHHNDLRVIDHGEKVVAEEVEILKKNNRALTFLSAKLPLRDASGSIQSLCGISTDITDYREIQAHNHRLTFYDPLTGLPNRRLLLDHLELVTKTVRRSNRYAALLFIDLDNFKVVNDLQGLHRGDQLLHRVAERLSEAVRESDTLARLGADEFVLLLHDLGEEMARAASIAERVAEKLLAAVLEARDLDASGLPTTGSIGITLFGGREASVDTAMQQADIALQQAKSAGGNALRFFSSEMQAAVMARVHLEADLHQALQRDELSLHYQVQVDGDIRVAGVEALLRWHHPRRGSVSPGVFIPLAESSQLILPIGHWVLATACRQLAAWADAPATEALTISVNVSSVQFQQADFVAQVQRLLADTGARPERLIMEVTESLLMDDPEHVRETMTALSELGIRFGLDDFGTGYSSLNYLKRLPLHQLKIDQSFVHDLLDDPVDAAIIETTITLANSLGLEVTAEGVETAEQHRWLKAHGCHSFQGYLYSRPVPREELVLGRLPVPAAP
ncbi:EAL domain-containing protein [Halomonas sp. NO4]|uniref:EAL domain-containing protein n=1 Tax=Halomonas sp. NO4 TaxID=2484813 RepID=UPI0013D7B989|nr:EAL domain-containing protein [Halomonas sp. NO4]